MLPTATQTAAGAPHEPPRHSPTRKARFLKTCKAISCTAGLSSCHIYLFILSRSSSCSSWTEQSEVKSLYGAQILSPDSQSCSSLDEAELDRCSSPLSVDSMASTFLPSPSPDSTRSPSTTRIGTQPGGARVLAVI